MIEKRLGFESAITKTKLGQLNKPLEPIKPTTTQNNNLPIVDQNLTGTVKSSNFKNTEYNFLGQNNNDISAKNLLDKVSDPEIKAKLEVLLTKLNDKNSVVFLDEIINNHQPKLDKGATLDVLNKLNKMADTKYNVSDTKILINSSLKDIAYPNQISQDNKDNCASIALQIQLANRSPFKYLNLLDKFAQGENVTLQNDKPFRLKPDLIKNLKPENISGNIMQTAFNQIDKSNDNTPLEAIFGDKLKYYQPGTLEDTDSLDKKMVNYLESAKPSKKNPIQVTMQYDQQHRDSFYMINITGIDKVKNTVNIINQKGQEESITIDKLKDNILGIFITDKLFESSTKSSNPLKAELSNIASNKFVDDIQNSSITVESLKKETFEKITDPNTQKSVSEFIEKFPDKKSISLYIHELAINRKPEISQDNFKNIISNLSKMLNDKYDSRIKNPKELISSTLHDISAPSDISQRDIGTCAGTSIQIQLALKDPIKYIKMIDTLAKNISYKSESGAVIKPNWTFKNEGKPELDKNGKPLKDKSGNIQYHPETNRTISSKIMQNAIMDYADGKRKYDSASSDENINSGLDDNEIKRGLEGVFPNQARIYSINNFSPEQLVNIAIKAKPSLANPVEINLNYADKGRDASHAVDLINVDKQKGLATIINPWGREETFPLSILKDRITSVINVEKEKINTEKMSDTDLKNMIDNKINVNGINQIINKVNDVSKKDSFLNSLNLDQKVKLIDTFSKKNPMPEENKKACLSVLENLLQGSEAQISDTSSTLNDKLKEKNISFDKLMDRLKLNDPSYYRLARIVDNANPEFNLATTLINDPKTSAKFISVLNKDQKIDIIDTLAKNYLAYDKKNEYPEDKKTAVTLLNNLLESEKSDKIFPDLDIKSKITFLNMGISTSEKLLRGLNNQEKTNLLKGIGELIDNKSIKPEEKEQLKSAYQNLVKNMLKDIEPNNQKQILKTILLALGSNNNFFQRDGISYASGLKAFKAYLPDNSETKNIFKLLS